MRPGPGGSGELRAIEKLLHKLRKEFREMFPLRSEFEPLKERHEEVEQSVSQLRKDNIEIVSRAEEQAKDVAKKMDVKAVRVEIEKFSKNLKMPEISLPTDSGEELLALKQMLEKFN